MTTTDQPYSPRGRKLLVWMLQAVLSGLFVTAGCAKLIGLPSKVEVFEQIGLGQWFRIATGLIEVLSGLALLFPLTSVPAACILAITMVFATVAHLTVLPPPALPALVLASLCLVLVWLRRETVARWLM